MTTITATAAPDLVAAPACVADEVVGHQGRVAIIVRPASALAGVMQVRRFLEASGAIRVLSLTPLADQSVKFVVQLSMPLPSFKFLLAHSAVLEVDETAHDEGLRVSVLLDDGASGRGVKPRAAPPRLVAGLLLAES